MQILPDLRHEKTNSFIIRINNEDEVMNNNSNLSNSLIAPASAQRLLAKKYSQDSSFKQIDNSFLSSKKSTYYWKLVYIWLLINYVFNFYLIWGNYVWFLCWGLYLLFQSNIYYIKIWNLII